MKNIKGNKLFLPFKYCLMRKIFLAALVSVTLFASAQKIEVLTTGTKTSLRGLSVVNNNILWVSGSNGMVGKSTNSGKTIDWHTVKGYEQRDFRDIEAFDDKTAIIMAVAEPAIILKTKDGGYTWKKVFEDTTKGMFLDCMDFTTDSKAGAVLGDPIDGNIFIAFTEDGGDTWKKDERHFPLQNGEALFAASGTNLKITNIANFYLGELVYVTGGKKSRLFFDDEANDIDMAQGTESQGANSLDISQEDKKLIAVGGDFLHDTISTNNCIILTENEDEDIIYSKPEIPPHGYRSCVAYILKNSWICCGTSGVDVSSDGGSNWKLISNESYNSCAKAKAGYEIYLAGKDGTVAKLVKE